MWGMLGRGLQKGKMVYWLFCAQACLVDLPFYPGGGGARGGGGVEAGVSCPPAGLDHVPSFPREGEAGRHGEGGLRPLMMTFL